MTTQTLTDTTGPLQHILIFLYDNANLVQTCADRFCPLQFFSVYVRHKKWIKKTCARIVNINANKSAIAADVNDVDLARRPFWFAVFSIKNEAGAGL